MNDPGSSQLPETKQTTDCHATSIAVVFAETRQHGDSVGFTWGVLRDVGDDLEDEPSDTKMACHKPRTYSTNHASGSDHRSLFIYGGLAWLLCLCEMHSSISYYDLLSEPPRWTTTRPVTLST